MTRTKGGTGGRKIPTGENGQPISGADLRRWRVRQAEVRGETLNAPLDRAEQAYQRAARAEAIAEEAARSAEQDRTAAAEARREYERLTAREERDRQASAPVIRAQYSSSGGDPWAGHPDHDPRVQIAIDETRQQGMTDEAALAHIGEARRKAQAAHDYQAAERRDRELNGGTALPAGGRSFGYDQVPRGYGEVGRAYKQETPWANQASEVVPLWQQAREENGPRRDDSLSRSVVYPGSTPLGSEPVPGIRGTGLDRGLGSLAGTGVPPGGITGNDPRRHFEAPRSTYTPDPQRQPREGYWATPAAAREGE